MSWKWRNWNLEELIFMTGRLHPFLYRELEFLELMYNFLEIHCTKATVECISLYRCKLNLGIVLNFRANSHAYFSIDKMHLLNVLYLVPETCKSNLQALQKLAG